MATAVERAEQAPASQQLSPGKELDRLKVGTAVVSLPKSCKMGAPVLSKGHKSLKGKGCKTFAGCWHARCL